MDKNRLSASDIGGTPGREDFIRAIPDQAPQGLYGVDCRTDAILYYNEAFLRIWDLGHLKGPLDRGELKNSEVMAYISRLVSDDPASLERLLMACSSPGDAQSVTVIWLADGRTIRLTGSEMPDDGGRSLGRLYIFEDVTRSTKAEEDARKSDERSKGLADLLPQIIFEMDLKGNLTFVNRSAFKLMGFTGEDFARGLNAIEMIVPEDRARALQNIQKVLCGGTSGQEYTFIRKDGSRFPAIIHSSVISRDGKPTGLRGIIIDITDRKKDEEKLLLTQASVDHFSDSCIWTSLDCQILYANDAACKSLGYTREELLTMKVTDVDTNHNEVHRKAAIAEMMKKGSCMFESLHRTKDGRLIPVEISLTYCRHGDKEFVISLNKDITERKRAEEKLLLTQASIDNFHDPCTWADEDGRLLYVNDAACKALGYSREELLRMKIPDIDVGFQEESFREQYSAIKSEGGAHLESLLRAKDGRIFPVELSVKSYRFGGKTWVVTFLRDITERRQNEKKLRLTQASIDNFHDPCMWMDADGHIKYVNDAVCKALGYSREELLRMMIPDIDPSCPAEQYKKIFAAIKVQGSARFETLHRSKGGRVYPVEISVKYIQYGNKDYAISFNRDITERKQTEEELRKLSTTVEQSPTGIKIIDSLGRITYANPRFTEMSGYGQDELIGQLNYKVPGGIFDPPTVGRLQDAIHHGKDWSGELQYRKKSGELFWVRSHVFPIRDATGSIKDYVEISEDITERKQAENKLAENLLFLQILIDTIPTPVFYKDIHGTYLGSNAAYEKYLGKSKAEIVGKTVYDIHPRELADIYHQSDVDLLVSGGFQTFEGKILHADGCRHDVVFYKATFNGTDDQPDGIIGTMLDITERKHMEERLRGSLREKEVLLKEVHHRVKNNLQIISSLLNLQLSGIDQEPVRQIMKESQNRVRSIALVHERMYMSDDLARIDFSEYLRSLANQLLYTYTPSPGQVHLTIDGDRIQLGVDQAVPCGLIMNELISNSLKHAFPGSRQGTIKIRLQDGGINTITIEDDGVGIPPEMDLANVSSMGMQLVSALVGQLDGTITLDRACGTRFTITFPVR